MAIGELVARLTCDSKNFDRNIKKSQKEIQEFKRKTEQAAAKVSSAFSGVGPAIGSLSPQLSGLIGSLGKIAPIAAASTAAFGLFAKSISKSEVAMDSLSKTTAQVQGAIDHLAISINNGDLFNGFISSLKEAVRVAGRLDEILDDIGTLKGYNNLNTAASDYEIARLKELKKSGASQEEISKQEAKAKKAVANFKSTSEAIVKDYKESFDEQVKGVFNKAFSKALISKKAGFKIIDKYATDQIWAYTFKDETNHWWGKNINSLKNNNDFVEFLKKNNVYNDRLFKDFRAGGEQGKDYVIGIIKAFRKLTTLSEKDSIVPLQETAANYYNTKREASEKVSNLYKQIYAKPEKQSKSGGRSIYTSKQEAPKERTLQDILDDLDKSLAWNKYLAQNLGEDITGANLSTLEKTANELKDLLKNTTDEEQRKKIISELKTINNIINKPKEVNKPKSNANFENIYGNEIGNLSLNNDAREQVLNSAKETKEWEIAFRDAYKGDKYLKVDLDDVVSVDTARKYNYDANEYFKDRLYGNIDDYNKKIVKSIFNAYKFSDYKFLNSEKRYKPASDPNNKISSFIPFGELSNLDIPIKYPEEFYYEREASTKFSSGVSSVVKKYTGFDTFRRDFAKNAYSEFDRLISEGNIITPNDVNKILYQVYLDTIKMYTDDTPDFFKNASDFYEFVNKKTNTNFNDKETKSKVNLILGEKNKNELIYQELLNNVSVPKEAKAGFGNDLATINAKSRSIKDINFGTDYIIGFINELSKGNTYEKARLLSEIKNKLIERREALTGLVATTDIGEDRVKLENNYKNLRLIQLEREKRSNKGVLSEENQKEYEELKKETGNDFSGSTNTQLETYEESFTRDAEKLAKSIEESNSIREDLKGKINQTDDLGNRIQKEEGENNVLRERQKVLGKLSKDYLSVADSAYQIGASFSTLDSKFGDVASVLLNVVGITAEAIGKLIGMATAEGVSNAFKLPWPQNLVAVATVVAAGASAAGQIAGLASKKYATGGIVSGPGTGISDSIPIRVSNGEMILNHRQQRNLFDLLNYGGGSSRGGGTSEVNFKILGENLVGSINNRNKGRNKIL